MIYWPVLQLYYRVNNQQPLSTSAISQNQMYHELHISQEGGPGITTTQPFEFWLTHQRCVKT